MIPFIDLAAQQKHIRANIDKAMGEVLDSGAYILGPQVAELEQKLSAFCGVKHSLACSNGTDALMLALMAIGIRGGDAVFVPSFTFAATAEVVPCMGGVPFFVDILPDTYNMDPESLKRCIKAATDRGLKPKAVIPVDLFGLPADFASIEAIARESGLKIICDTAQGFGGTINGRMIGSLGDIATTSFYPAKPLGCYGDGGALFTQDDAMAELIDSYRVHGKGSDKYDNIRIGMNARLDTLQAVVLLEKLKIYPDELIARNRIAERYTSALAKACGNTLITPIVPEGYSSVWAQYTVRVADDATRSHVQQHLASREIPTAVFYPNPLHRQTAYNMFPSDPKGMAATDAVAAGVFSLPMHPYLDEATQDKIVAAMAEALTP